MTLINHRTPSLFTAVIAAVALVCSGHGIGQIEARKAPASIEMQELKTAFELARKQLIELKLENRKLKAQNEALTEGLAQANAEGETIRREHEELLLRVASFGVDLLKPDPKSLEQRLLKAVRDHQLAEDEKEKLARQLLRLSEVAVNFMQTTVGGDAGGRDLLERELRAASGVLGQATATAHETVRSLGDGKVVSIEPDIGLVVLNIGRKSGVRVGMPIRILRTNQLVGTAMVVDVRDSIAGAVLQKVAAGGEDVRVGDRIEPEAQQL